MEPPSNILELPRDIVLSILARISNSYYPAISLVSKSFRSIIQSEELYRVRSHLGTGEVGLVVVLQPPTHPCDRKWFTLWINPDNRKTSLPSFQKKKKKKKKTFLPYSKTKVNSTGNWLLPLGLSNLVQGSNICEIGTEFSSDVWVRDNRFAQPRKAPSMTVARKNPLSCMEPDGKIYVMGGCEADETMYWAEVFDPKTQTWEPLPDPGPDLRFSTYKAIFQTREGHLCVTRKNTKYKNKKKKEKEKLKRKKMINFVYITQKNSWLTFQGTTPVGDSICFIGHLSLRCSFCQNRCFWCDGTKLREWRMVQGLSELDQHEKVDTEIGTYGEKLVIVWVAPPKSPLVSTSQIWCAMVLLEKRQDGWVWGQIEWIDHVLTVPPNTLVNSVTTLLE